MAKELNTMVDEFRTRPLDQGPYFYSPSHSSPAWSGEEDGEKRDAVALMVRSGEGTIDEPHFIWMKDGDSFKSVTKGTADASSMDSDLSQATSAMVANSINCLTADFR